MELFFKDCLGGRAQTTVAPAIGQHIARLTVNVDTLTLAPRESEPTTMLLGDAAIATIRLAPETATRRLMLVQGGQEREIGTLRNEMTFTDVGGRPAVLRIQTLTSPMLGGTSVDTVVVERTTLAPIRHRSINARRTMSLDFRGDSIVGSVIPAGAAAQAVALRADTALFDANTIDLIMRVLPLAEGYAVRHPVYLNEGGGKVWVSSRVVGSERVAGEGGAMVDAWIVESKIGPQTVRLWIAKDSREVLQSMLEAAPGVQLKMVR